MVELYSKDDEILLSAIEAKDEEIDRLNSQVAQKQKNVIRRRGFFKYMFSDTPYGFLLAGALFMVGYNYIPDIKSPTDNFYANYSESKIYHEYDWGSDVIVWETQEGTTASIKTVSGELAKAHESWENRSNTPTPAASKSQRERSSSEEVPASIAIPEVNQSVSP